MSARVAAGTISDRPSKPLVFIGPSKEELSAFPEEVKRVAGYALRTAQQGGKHSDAKPLKGYNGAGVLEIVEPFDTDTYRAVYTVEFSSVVFVLYAFQKKSKRGNATPKRDLDLIDRRYKAAQRLYKSPPPELTRAMAEYEAAVAAVKAHEQTSTISRRTRR